VKAEDPVECKGLTVSEQTVPSDPAKSREDESGADRIEGVPAARVIAVDQATENGSGSDISDGLEYAVDHSVNLDEVSKKLNQSAVVADKKYETDENVADGQDLEQVVILSSRAISNAWYLKRTFLHPNAFLYNQHIIVCCACITDAILKSPESALPRIMSLRRLTEEILSGTDLMNSGTMEDFGLLAAGAQVRRTDDLDRSGSLGLPYIDRLSLQVCIGANLSK